MDDGSSTGKGGGRKKLKGNNERSEQLEREVKSECKERKRRVGEEMVRKSGRATNSKLHKDVFYNPGSNQKEINVKN